MAGAGYASASTLHSQDDRDYHYGIAPQALLALRLIHAGHDGFGAYDWR
jgi:hypothetical protein